MNVDNLLKVIRGVVRLRGGTDNTVIGNSGVDGDALKVVNDPVLQTEIVCELRAMNDKLNVMITLMAEAFDLEISPGDFE